MEDIKQVSNRERKRWVKQESEWKKSHSKGKVDCGQSMVDRWGIKI
jgi:hypothetical protein